MTDLHHHHGGDTTILEDREGPATALIVLVVMALVGFLIWLFAFSGVVFDRSPSSEGGSTTNIEQNVDNPPDQNTNTNTVPSAPSS